MNKSIQQFMQKPNATIYEALKSIDENMHGFLLIIDDDENFLGTLTDGDIRRALIDGHQVTDSIHDIYNQNNQTLCIDNEVTDTIDIFKNEAIKFLPIVDEKGKLVNLITKQQVYSLLLQDIAADLSYDFMQLNESAVDYEIFNRPWGFYRTTVMNEYFQSKVISVNPNSQLSLQSHNHREEYWIIAHGHGTVQIGESIMEVHCGTSLFIPKGCKHRLINTDDHESLIVTEVQLGDYFGEDDIIRYEDIYGRV